MGGGRGLVGAGSVLAQESQSVLANQGRACVENRNPASERGGEGTLSILKCFWLKKLLSPWVIFGSPVLAWFDRGSPRGEGAWR